MVTITEIAKRANVSVGTVDRVIHNRGRVSKETEQRIRQIINELDYKPNILARSLSLSRIFKFGVLMPQISANNYYWEIATKGIRQAEKELKLHKVQIRYFCYEGYSESSFLRVAHNVLQENLDGLLFAPSIYKSINNQFIEQIPGTLPFIFFNSNIPHANCLSYIGQDSFQSGVLSAQLMHLIARTDGTIAVLTVRADDYHINERVKGFLSYFHNIGKKNIKIYGPERTEEKNIFNNILTTIFQEDNDLQGIYSTTALTYRIAEFIVTNGINKKINLIGYDLTAKNIYYLNNGMIDFLISQRPEIQGFQGIYALYRHVVLGEPVEKKMMIPLDIVTKENLSYYPNLNFNVMSVCC